MSELAARGDGIGVDMEANKKTVVAFLDRMLNQKDAAGAAANYLGDHYIQHNPTVPDGVQGYVSRFGNLKEVSPQLRWELKRVFAEGDFVVTHARTVVEPGGTEIAAADFWRLENGKIVEHWDVLQNVPKESANSNTMF